MDGNDGRYIYAVTKSGVQVEGLAAGGGRGRSAVGREVQAIAEGPVAAVVSPFSGSRIRAERRNIGGHFAVLRNLMKAGTSFLPVAFGTVSSSEEELRATLRANRDTCLADLERLSGKTEMGLKVRWDVPNIFEYFVFRYPHLAELRDRLTRRPGGATREDQIVLGRSFESTLDEAREHHLATVRGVLEPVVAEFEVATPGSEELVLDIACLIDRRREKEFEEKVFEAAALFDDHFAFDYNGPWPPFHFVRAALSSSGERATCAGG